MRWRVRLTLAYSCVYDLGRYLEYNARETERGNKNDAAGNRSGKGLTRIDVVYKQNKMSFVISVQLYKHHQQRGRFLLFLLSARFREKRGQ